MPADNTSPEPDGYYNEDDASDSEIDLSFLDDKPKQ